LFNSISIFSQENIRAKISTKVIDNLIDITALAQNEDETFKDEFSYVLFSLKTSAQGNLSKNTQSGEFSLSPNEEKELSTLKINIQQGEQFKVYLFIRKEGQLISKDSTLIYAAERNEEKVNFSESEIEISGLVIEDVKTKPGKDFYDYFYQKYTTSGNKYPFIVNIIEKPGLGRGSKISVNVEDRTIFEFVTQPKEEYMQAAADQALQYLKSYAAKRKLLYRNKKF
jgi:hypothetical protein